MGKVNSNGISIEFEEFGDLRDPAILLIMGYAAQMVVWPVSFCEALANLGFRVIRFDNRDCGLSTHFDGVKAPGIARSLFASLLHINVRTPYSLEDMADDAIGLLDARNVRTAHVVGASMGGMIAQIMAAKHPERVRSLTSVMSTSGNRRLPGPKPRVLRHVLFGQRKNMHTEAVIDYMCKFWERIESPDYPTSSEERRRLVSSWVERDCDMAASFRQFAAMAATRDRTESLRSIALPTLVIHGEADPLIRVEGGRHTAANIAGAELLVVPGMGHDMPEALVPLLVEHIATHCSIAEKAAASDFVETGSAA